MADVTGIIDIIEPLMQDGVLTQRSRKELEHDIGQYYVFTRDGLTVACGQLRRFEHCAEIGCLAVHPAYRKGGRGDAMLAYLERIAVNSGLSTIFVLSTRYVDQPTHPPTHLTSNQHSKNPASSIPYQSTQPPTHPLIHPPQQHHAMVPRAWV